MFAIESSLILGWVKCLSTKAWKQFPQSDSGRASNQTFHFFVYFSLEFDWAKFQIPPLRSVMFAMESSLFWGWIKRLATKAWKQFPQSDMASNQTFYSKWNILSLLLRSAFEMEENNSPKGFILFLSTWKNEKIFSGIWTVVPVVINICPKSILWICLLIGH